jgi:hypothetical protein
MRFVSDLVVETPYTRLDSRRTVAVDDGIVDEGEIGYILRLCRLFLLVLLYYNDLLLLEDILPVDTEPHSSVGVVDMAAVVVVDIGHRNLQPYFYIYV